MVELSKASQQYSQPVEKKCLHPDVRFNIKKKYPKDTEDYVIEKTKPGIT